MAVTKKQVVDDLELQLLASAPSDDSELSKLQLAFWFSYHLNIVVTDEINSKLKRGEMIPSLYIKEVSNEVGILDDDSVYIELDDEILTLNKDWGVIEVETDDGTTIRKASVETLQLFKHLRFSKPSEANLLYSKVGNRIYIKGMQGSDIPFDEIKVKYIPKQNLLEMDDDDEILVSDYALPQVIDLTVQRGKMELYGTQSDQANDGVDYKKTMYHTAIQNPNSSTPQ